MWNDLPHTLHTVIWDDSGTDGLCHILQARVGVSVSVRIKVMIGARIRNEVRVRCWTAFLILIYFVRRKLTQRDVKTWVKNCV